MTKRLARSSTQKWKQAVALGCAAYLALAWVLPLLMTPFVNVLPFVHKRDTIERLWISCLATLFVTVVLLAMNPRCAFRSFDLSVGASFAKRWRNRVGVLAGLAMFTYSAAWLSANPFGLAARVLPGTDYEEVVVLDNVAFQGSRYRTAVLDYRSPEDGTPRYLVLSQRLFDYPKLTAGDLVRLRGKATTIGVYVTGIEQMGQGAAIAR